MADKTYSVAKSELVHIFSKLQKGQYITYRHASFCASAHFIRIFDDEAFGWVLELQSNSGDTHYVPIHSLASVVISAVDPCARKGKLCIPEVSDDSS